jgi:hypothetical protein
MWEWITDLLIWHLWHVPVDIMVDETRLNPFPEAWSYTRNWTFMPAPNTVQEK